MILRMTRPPARAASNNRRQLVLSLAVSAVEAGGREAILGHALDVCTLARGRFGVPARQVFQRARSMEMLGCDPAKLTDFLHHDATALCRREYKSGDLV
jgi:hypothetical protein